MTNFYGGNSIYLEVYLRLVNDLRYDGVIR